MWGISHLKYTGILLPQVFTTESGRDIIELTPRGWKGNYREELEAPEKSHLTSGLKNQWKGWEPGEPLE